MTQIANATIAFLKKGEYHDTTGVAIPHKSPQQKPCQTTGEQQITTENKKYKNMKKQTIRLNENQLRKVIKESVSNMINNDYRTKLQQIAAELYDLEGECVDNCDEHDCMIGLIGILERYGIEPSYNSLQEGINELDWKTYANAAKKQAKRDGEYQLSHENPNRAYKFNLAASHAFNKQHGYKEENLPWKSVHSNEPTNWGTRELPKLNLNVSDGNEFLAKDYNDEEKPYRHNPPFKYPTSLKQTKHMPSGTFRNSPELNQHFKSAEQEMDNYYNGNYDYTPEQGWHLKEEKKLDESIRRSIRKYLH